MSHEVGIVGGGLAGGLSALFIGSFRPVDDSF